MQNSYITKAEEAAIEEKVALMFQKMNDGADYSHEYEWVREKTKLLFYLIPRRSYYLERELCSEFYLSMVDSVDKVIMSYRISLSVPYVAYLHIILRGRAFAFLSRRSENIQRENDFIYTSVKMLDASDVFEYEPEWDAGPIQEGPPARPPEKITLSDVIEVIIKASPSTDVSGDRRRDLMLEYLREKDNRLRFMLFLLVNTDSLTRGEISDLSELMNVPEKSFAELSVLLYTLSEKRHDSAEQQYDNKINRAWKRYVLLTSAFHNPKTTDEEKKELQFQLEAALRKIRTKQESKSMKKRGLSLTYISASLGYSTAMISSSVRQVESFIEALSSTEKAGA